MALVSSMLTQPLIGQGGLNAAAPLLGYQLSAFGLVRVGAPFLLADLVNRYQIDSNYWGTAVTGTGDVAHVPAQSAISVLAGANSGTAKLETHEHFRYQAGKAIRWLMTGYSSDTGNTRSVREWGQFTDSDGIFFRHARATVGNYLDLVIRTNTSGTPADSEVIAQSAWNIDKMDGTGPSHVTLDPSKASIYEVTYQWLGVGEVIAHINGHRVHIFEHANLLSKPYMSTAQLPLRVLVTEAGGSAGASGWTSICSAIYAEGGDEPALFGFAASKSGAPFALSTTETPLISIRPANTVNSIANRGVLIPRHMTLSAGSLSGGANTVTFKVYLNATLTTGTTWASAGTGSIAEADQATTAVGFVAGTLVEVAVLGDLDTVMIDFDGLFSLHGRKLMRRDLAAQTLDSLTITAKLNAGTGNGSCDIVWVEAS